MRPSGVQGGMVAIPFSFAFVEVGKSRLEKAAWLRAWDGLRRLAWVRVLLLLLLLLTPSLPLHLILFLSRPSKEPRQIHLVSAMAFK